MPKGEVSQNKNYGGQAVKSIGVIRKLDQLGRITLPKELRDNLGFEENQPLEIYTKEDLIILKRYKAGCYCCGNLEVEGRVLGLSLCKKCINEFNDARNKIDKLR